MMVLVLWWEERDGIVGEIERCGERKGCGF